MAWRGAARRGVGATLFERCGFACGASGNGGGFLAAGWCDGTAVGLLARRSFALHAELAERLEGDWGYRRMDASGARWRRRAVAGRVGGNRMGRVRLGI